MPLAGPPPRRLGAGLLNPSRTCSQSSFPPRGPPACAGATALRHPAQIACQERRCWAQLTLVYTWIHGLVFCAIGVIAAKLLARVEENPDLGFGILLLSVVATPS